MCPATENTLASLQIFAHVHQLHVLSSNYRSSVKYFCIFADILPKHIIHFEIVTLEHIIYHPEHLTLYFLNQNDCHRDSQLLSDAFKDMGYLIIA